MAARCRRGDDIEALLPWSFNSTRTLVRPRPSPPNRRARRHEPNIYASALPRHTKNTRDAQGPERTTR